MEFNDFVTWLLAVLILSTFDAIGANGQPNLFALNTSSARQSYQGKVIKCFAMIEDPIIFESKSTDPYKMDGLAIEYLDLLQKKLDFSCNFTDNVLQPTDLYGFEDVINDAGNCISDGPVKRESICEVDLFVGGWTITKSRVGKVQFLPDFIRHETRVVTHRDNLTGAGIGMFFPQSFTLIVWVLIALLFTCFAVLRVLDNRFQVRQNNFEPLDPKQHGFLRRALHVLKKGELSRRLRYSVLATAREMVNSGSSAQTEPHHSTRNSVLSLLIVVSGLYLILSSEAVMTATLVQETMVSDFQSAEDIAECRIDSNEICIFKSGAVESFWKNAFQDFECANKYDTIDSFEQLFEEASSKKKCKYVVEGPPAWKAVNRKYCGTLYFTGDPLQWGGDAFMVPNGSPLYSNFATATLSLKEQAKLRTLDSFFDSRGSCARQERVTLGLSKMRPFFIFGFGSVLIMFLLLIFYPQSPTPEPSTTHVQDEDHPRNLYRTEEPNAPTADVEEKPAIELD